MDAPESGELVETEDTSAEKTCAWPFPQDNAAEEDDRVHYLVVVNGPDAGKRFEIGATPVIVGRRPDNEVCLNDGMVSGLHCRVQVVQEHFVVTDLQSTNGTYIEGAPLRTAGVLPIESFLRVGHCMLKHEYRRRRDVEQAALLSYDLKKAAAYVRALLPPPIVEGPLQVEWSFVPSLLLGGDAFGYHPLGDTRWAIYLLDVCGHGVAAAMHSVSAINVIRQQTLPDIDFARPDQVIGALNRTFQMDVHGNMYFTLWYGVYDTVHRRIDYASAGHPPAVLVTDPRAPVRQLGTRTLAVGMYPHTAYQTRSAEIPRGSTLYIYSDGAFEVTTAQGRTWTLTELQQVLLLEAGRGRGEADRILQRIFELAGRRTLEDDFSLMVCTFPE